jgi:hypothetical protein
VKVATEVPDMMSQNQELGDGTFGRLCTFFHSRRAQTTLENDCPDKKAESMSALRDEK